jgi:small-conductance mechanosensitive channel
MILGNALSNYLQFLLAFALSIGLAFLFKYIIIDKIKYFTSKTKTKLDDVIVSFFSSISLPFYVLLSLYIAIQFLVLNTFVRRIIDAVFITYVVYQVIFAVRIFIEYFLDKRATGENGASIAHVKDILQMIMRVVFWAIGILFILSNLGINVTSLVAGLGIGGIAIALAVQNVLGDLFSYFAICFDKPFIKGDIILVGDQMGVIEKIGVKTTRIRALQGEEIVISNSELTSSRIQNFKKMEERRVLFSLGVVYETPLAQLERIPPIIRDIISSLELTRFDRAHLSAFGDSAYLYEVVYYVLSADYHQYMDIQQTINFRIIEAFTREHIEFAFPAQTPHLVRG